MQIFGFNITRDKTNPSCWAHVALAFTKRGRLCLFINGVEYKNKNFTIDFWTNDVQFAKFANGYSCISKKELK